MNNSSCGLPDENGCACCYGTDNTAANPLLVLGAKDSYTEFVHLHCARTHRQFGFCWCCGESRAFNSENLNEAGECDLHDGESKSDYSEEDAESFIENIRNNE